MLQPPKILGYNFAEKSKIFQFLFFKIFFIKKNNSRHRAGIKASILQLYVLAAINTQNLNYDQEKIAAVLWCNWNLTKHSIDWNFNTSFLDVFDILYSKVFWFYCPRLSIELMDGVTYNFYKKWWIHIKLTKKSFKIHHESFKSKVLQSLHSQYF